MSQRDLDSVKSKLKGLWTQYSSGSTTPMPRSTQPATDPAGNPLVEELLLFPTYAYRDERLKVWRVQVRGWGYCRNPTTRRVRYAAALMRRFIRIEQGGDSDQMLVDRVSYLFAGQPASSEMVKVAMAGIAEPAPFELHVRHHPPPLPARGSTAGPAGSRSIPPPKPPRAASATATTSAGFSSAPASLGPVSLLDAPIVLTSQFDPRDGRVPQPQPPRSEPSEPSGHNHDHDHMVRGPMAGVEPTIIQKALQIDAFAWQNLVLDEGLFQGEILLGFNELEWLLQSYRRPAGERGGSDGRRLVELRGRLFGWPASRVVSGVAHLVEPRGVSVVSDIDDTIKASNITAEKRIVLETVFARPLKAVPGMAALYRAWYDAGCEFHYVSNSPWQLYPSLDDFFHANRFPPGSAHLRSFDPNDLLSVSNYTGTPQLKRDTIEQLFRTFPLRKYVLVGDCGEHDLETYTDLARRFPGRVLRIYIRDVFAPMGVPAVTTDTDVAGNSVGEGLIPYGIVRPDGMRRQRQQQQQPAPPDLIDFGDEVDAAIAREDAKDAGSRDSGAGAANHGPPAVPPKPAHLSGASRAASYPDAAPPKPPRKPANATASPGIPGGFPPSSTAPDAGSDPADGAGMSAAERFDARVAHLREQAQAWMAFYAQRFYVAPTQSFLRYAGVFMPTVEQDMRIIDYEAVPHEMQQVQQAMQQQQAMQMQQQQQMGSAGTFDLGSQQQQQGWAGAQTPQPASRGGSGYNTPLGALPSSSRAASFATFSIPEPPPVEAQLARNARRLLLWKRYLAATQGLPPQLCRLFVDASDIQQDAELATVLIPQHAAPQL
ncbi:hypothetical protein GGI15_002856 [Coemansia interrupta]|uniref:Phosphatidate phosphatase APP1 catalytic domain-containing protein n=1 Tax=Coemansia interrupta TaxID=1126814 RepID=A0A9W8HFA6_9FUNG|nr:hypothetical protein GGI15_002856 [Coemansia interrupta]